MPLQLAGAAPAIKIRISNVLNQGSDMEVEQLPPAELAAMRRIHAGVMGDNLSPPLSAGGCRG